MRLSAIVRTLSQYLPVALVVLGLTLPSTALAKRNNAAVDTPASSSASASNSPSTSSSASKSMSKPVTERGTIQHVYLDKRMLGIGDQVYKLADDLVVKDRHDKIFENYRLHYLTWTYLIEYTRIDDVIVEIKILEHTS